jgi:hypothetical protein
VSGTVSKIMPFVAGLLAPVMLFGVVYVSMLVFTPADSPEPQDTELLADLTPIEANQNANTELDKAKASYSGTPTDSDFFLSGGFALETARAVLANNQQTLQYIEAALELPRAQAAIRNPIFANTTPEAVEAMYAAASSATLLDGKFLHSLLLLRAKVELEVGNDAAANTDINRALRLAWLWQNDGGTVFNQIFALSLYENINNQIIAALKSQSWSQSGLASVAQSLGKYSPVAIGLTEAYRSEYLFAKQSIAALGKSSTIPSVQAAINDSTKDIPLLPTLLAFTPRGYWIQPNTTIETVRENVANAVSAAGQCDVDTKSWPKTQLSASTPFNPNGLGLLARATFNPNLAGVHNSFCKRHEQTRLSAVFVAMRRFELRQKRLPTTLAELVPNYLADNTWSRGFSWDGKTISGNYTGTTALPW